MESSWVVLDNEELRGTYFLQPKLGQEQSHLRVRWVPGDLCNADVQLGVQLAMPVAVCWAVVMGYAPLPREYWSAVLLFQQTAHCVLMCIHCSTRGVISCISFRSTCIVRII